MDISNEASVYPFAIGPFTILGRTIAFKILFCNSLERLPRELSDTVAGYFRGFAKILKPHCSWRRPQTVLIIVAVLAFLVKRLTNVKSRAEGACRRNFWSNMMKTALTYDDWANAATMLDRGKRGGGNSKTSESDLYDEELVRNKLRELQHRRKEGSLRDIMFYMRADLFRNLGNMCNPDLHKGRLQVPKLIKEYIDEVSEQLRMVCVSESDEQFQLEEKLSFMHETRHAFGRTALLLSGGASLGAFHVGVVRTLVEHKLLPRIIAGTSAGSVICAIVGTQSSSELQNFGESWYTLKFFGQLGGIFTVVKRVMSGGAVHEIRHLQMLLRTLTNNLTFQEAYDVTGRILGITVCSPRKHEPARCLNYLTSPHVVIWSAVTASCAFPGLFEAQELMAKNRSGELVPYHPPFHLDPEEGEAMPPRRWRDGGLEMDLPKMQLKELFNVNHFIVSQANPHASAVLRLKEFARAYGGNLAVKLVEVAEMEVKHRCSQMLELGFPFQGIMKVMKQDWEGDITVVVHATPLQYTRIIQNPSYTEIQKAVNQGRRCVWEKLSAIKSNCDIELALDECVSVLNHVRRLRSGGGGGAVPCRRIPSWNCIARERSTGSLEEYIVPGVFHHDMSDGESEMADLHSWTQTGGPLMRTTSANRFVEFIRTLHGDEVNAPDQCDKQLDAEYPQLDCSGNESGGSLATDDSAADPCAPICP